MKSCSHRCPVRRARLENAFAGMLSAHSRPCGPVVPSRIIARNEPTGSPAVKRRIQYLIQRAWRYPCAHRRSKAIGTQNTASCLLDAAYRQATPSHRGLHLTVNDQGLQCAWPRFIRGQDRTTTAAADASCCILVLFLLENFSTTVSSLSCLPACCSCG